MLDSRVLLMGERAGDLWLLAIRAPGGCQSRLILGAVVSLELSAEQGEHSTQHQPGFGPVLGSGGLRGEARVIFSAPAIRSMAAGLPSLLHLLADCLLKLLSGLS